MRLMHYKCRMVGRFMHSLISYFHSFLLVLFCFVCLDLVKFKFISNFIHLYKPVLILSAVKESINCAGFSVTSWQHHLFLLRIATTLPKIPFSEWFWVSFPMRGTHMRFRRQKGNRSHQSSETVMARCMNRWEIPHGFLVRSSSLQTETLCRIF